jgi:hypothetical protein
MKLRKIAVRTPNVIATAGIALGPTVALLKEKAAGLGREVEIRDSLSTAALEALMQGDKDKRDAIVLETARQLAPSVDSSLFAQASMMRLASVVQETTGRPVLTSSRLAIEHTKRVLDGCGQNSKGARVTLASV